jgi:uncharacterized protein YndB with AHSA1/START domain
MENGLFIRNEIVIDAPRRDVWSALVEPDQTRQYMFDCETVSDWKEGSELLWRGAKDGVVYVKGVVIEIRPAEYLSYTTIDPHSNIDDTSENYLTVTYTLTEQEGKTHLTVTQGDYSKVAEGTRRFKESSNGGEGWNPILVAIKNQVEGSR